MSWEFSLDEAKSFSNEFILSRRPFFVCLYTEKFRLVCYEGPEFFHVHMKKVWMTHNKLFSLVSRSVNITEDKFTKINQFL